MPNCTCGCPESSHMGLPMGCTIHGFHNYEADVVMSATHYQIGGDHYKDAAMQPWDVWEAFGLDPWEASAVKYILRWRKKNGVEDLKKARHYLDYLIEREQKNGA